TGGGAPPESFGYWSEGPAPAGPSYFLELLCWSPGCRRRRRERSRHLALVGRRPCHWRGSKVDALRESTTLDLSRRQEVQGTASGKPDSRLLPVPVKVSRDACWADRAEVEVAVLLAVSGRQWGLLEEVFVDLDDGDRAFGLDADAVADHQAGQAGAVDENEAGGHRFGVGAGTRTESCCGDEDALTSLVAVQRSDEGLDLRAADGGVGGVALGLDVDTGQAEGVLVDDTVDAAIVGELGSGGVTFRAAIAHRDEQIEHCLFEECGIVGVQPGEQVGGNFGVDA